MARPRFMVLHKSEWERLKKEAGPPEITQSEAQNAYIKGLIEKSREWLKTWPDSVQGTVIKVAKLKEKRQQRDKMIVEAAQDAERRKKWNNSGEIERARQLIFENSCYGRQLVSALVESKNMEEREIQIQFNKFLKEEAFKLEKEQQEKNNFYFGQNEEEILRIKRQLNKQFAEENKNEHITKIEKIKKTKEEERKGELEDARLMQQLLDIEAHEMDDCKKLAQKSAKEYEIEQKKIREQRVQREKDDEERNKIWNKYHDRIMCKERQVMHEIHHGRNDDPMLKSTYNLIEKLNEGQTKRYNDFVQKGVRRFEKRCLRKERADLEQQEKLQKEARAYAEDNKKTGEEQQLMENCNKCVCVRQSLFTSPCKRVIKEPICIDKEEEKCVISTSFLVPSTKMREGLKQRSKLPTPWNALDASHKQFAQQADMILKECRVKKMAKKVVDEYWKINKLDSTKLPVPNYSLN